MIRACTSLTAVVSVALLAAACHVRVGSSSTPSTPAPAPAPTPTPPSAENPATAPATAPGAAPAFSTKVRPGALVVGKRGRPSTTPAAPSTSPTTPEAPTTPPASAAVPALSGASAFGSGTEDANAFAGTVYVIPDATTTMPDFASLAPVARLWTKELQVTPVSFAAGFAGLNNRKEHFAIRYEGPLEVADPADYDLRLVSDDGAIVSIDGMMLLDNNGTHATPTEKKGPVHLVKGRHVLRVDYFVSKAPATLQLFCKRAGGTEKPCSSPL